MSVFKSTMIFDGPKHGWTESYYQDVASNSYTVALSNLEALADRRSPMLGRQCRIIGGRVSRVDRKNDGLSGELNLVGPSGCDSDEPDACLVVIYRDPDNARHKITFMRGIPDAIDVQFGQFVDTECDFRAKFQTFANYISSPLRTWGWYGRPLIGPTRSDITGYTVLPSNQVTINFAGNLFAGVPLGTRVTINVSGVNTPAKSVLSGQVVVIVDAVNAATTFVPLAVFPYSHGGVALYAPSEFIPIRSATPVRIGTRRVGAPLLSSRGRARVRGKG